ncbi:hypothetical protein BJ546DRAFT_1045549 [Cryomyces antarcticus]
MINTARVRTPTATATATARREHVLVLLDQVHAMHKYGQGEAKQKTGTHCITTRNTQSASPFTFTLHPSPFTLHHSPSPCNVFVKTGTVRTPSLLSPPVAAFGGDGVSNTLPTVHDTLREGNPTATPYPTNCTGEGARRETMRHGPSGLSVGGLDASKSVTLSSWRRPQIRGEQRRSQERAAEQFESETRKTNGMEGPESSSPKLPGKVGSGPRIPRDKGRVVV